MMSSEKNNILCLNSFPRTGNTFLQQNIQTFIYKNNLNISFISHVHDYHLLLNNNLKQVSILRNPLDTLTSFILTYIPSKGYKIDNELLELLDLNFDIYINFLENMQNKDYIYIIDFEYLISEDINKTIINILNYFNFEFDENYIEINKTDLMLHLEANKKKHKNNYYSLNYPKNNILEKVMIQEIIQNHKKYDNTLSKYKKQICDKIKYDK